jgi:hypothetical protein
VKNIASDIEDEGSPVPERVLASDASSIVGYLQKMCQALVQVLPRVVGEIGNDQAVHNYLPR